MNQQDLYLRSMEMVELQSLINGYVQHAKYFVGTKESTFSFRIQEERDILGFNPDTTFNCLCSDKEIVKCEQPTRWRIVY